MSDLAARARGLASLRSLALCLALALGVTGCGNPTSEQVMDDALGPRFSSSSCGPNATPLEHGKTVTLPIVNLTSRKAQDLRVRAIQGPAGQVEATVDLQALNVTIRSIHQDGPDREDRFELVVDLTSREDFGWWRAGPEDDIVTSPLVCEFVVVHAHAVTGPSPSAQAVAPTARPVSTAAAAAAATTAAAGTVRVTGQPAIYSGGCSNYAVTFVWIVEGTQTGNFMMRIGKGDAYGPESGPFLLPGNGDSLTWDPATGRLTIRGASDSGASPGFRGQITKVNGRDVAGDATSIAAPGHCS